MGLLVVLESFAVRGEVNGEFWEGQDGSFDVHQSVLDSFADREDHSACHCEVSVEPGVPQASPVQHHVQLDEA